MRPDTLATPRRAPWVDLLHWLGAAGAMALIFAAGTALALRLDPQAGRPDALADAVLIELAPLPPTEALASLPSPAAPPPPEVLPKPQPVPAEPEAVQPEPSVPPEPAPIPEPEPVAQPEPAATAQQLNPLPRPKPRPQRVAEAEPSPKKAKKPATPKQKVKPQAPPAAAKVGGGTARAAKGSAPADALAQWERKVQGQLAGYLRRKSFGAKTAQMALAIRIDAQGTITSIQTQRSSGDAALDARVVAHLSGKRAVAATPSGKGTTLYLPVQLR